MSYEDYLRERTRPLDAPRFRLDWPEREPEEPEEVSTTCCLIEGKTAWFEDCPAELAGPGHSFLPTGRIISLTVGQTKFSREQVVAMVGLKAVEEAERLNADWIERNL